MSCAAAGCMAHKRALTRSLRSSPPPTPPPLELLAGEPPRRTCSQRVAHQRDLQPLCVQRAQQGPELPAQEERCPPHAAVAVARLKGRGGLAAVAVVQVGAWPAWVGGRVGGRVCDFGRRAGHACSCAQPAGGASCADAPAAPSLVWPHGVASWRGLMASPVASRSKKASSGDQVPRMTSATSRRSSLPMHHSTARVAGGAACCGCLASGQGGARHPACPAQPAAPEPASPRQPGPHT